MVQFQHRLQRLLQLRGRIPNVWQLGKMVQRGSAVSSQVVQLGGKVRRIAAVSQQVVQLEKMVWRGSAVSQ